MRLLDCTLRDGGYYTDWDFDQELVKAYFKAMESLPIEYVEIGYRSLQQEGYFGKYFFCSKSVLEEARSLMPSKKIAVMINTKEFETEDVSRVLSGLNDQVDLVRMAISPDNIPLALRAAKGIRDLGFSVAGNIMYLSKWYKEPESIISQLTSAELFDFIYLVDSYGSMMPDQVADVCQIVTKEASIPVGFHGHNNLELALANSLAAHQNGAEIIDSTIWGMGRGAGNLRTEVLLTYLQSAGNEDIRLDTLAQVIPYFDRLMEKYRWGTNLPYIISGAFSLPQKEVMDMFSTRRYSITTIVNQLQSETQESPSLSEFQPRKMHRSCLIIGGGQSVQDHLIQIKRWASIQQDLLIIHSSARYAKEFVKVKTDQVYCMSGDEIYRLERTFEKLESVPFPCIYPPTPKSIRKDLPKSILDRSFKLGNSGDTKIETDNPLSIALMVADAEHIEEVELVGFDGYDETTKSSEMVLMNENQSILDHFIAKGFSIRALTQSSYENIQQSSIYATQ